MHIPAGVAVPLLLFVGWPALQASSTLLSAGRRLSWPLTPSARSLSRVAPPHHHGRMRRLVQQASVAAGEARESDMVADRCASRAEALEPGAVRAG